MILQDQVALVTRGTSGIGRATAFAQRSVGAASRREGKLNVRVASRREVIA
jgi:NAD(P)-dependent dehydrogenase (short-subunit alcohol dehydrogenase family)